MIVHPDKTASRAVDACGGNFPRGGSDYDDGWVQGYCTALNEAAEAVRSVDALMEDMLRVLPDLLEHSISHYGHPKDETCGVGLVHARARAAIEMATQS